LWALVSAATLPCVIARMAVVALVALTLPAFADEPVILSETQAATDDALRLALEARAQGKFRRASERFLRAFELSRNPLALENAAKSLEEGQLSRLALGEWRRYLALEGLEAQKRELAELHIRALSAEVAREDAREMRQKQALARTSTSTALVVAPRPESWNRDTVRYVLIGCGAAAAISGTIFVLSGHSTYARFERTIDSGQEVTRAQADEAQVSTTLGVTLLSVGAAFAFTGLVIPWISPQPEAAVSLVPLDGGALVTFGGGLDL